MYNIKNIQVNQEQITQLLTKLGYLLKTHNLFIDSRSVSPDGIFCAYQGTKVDGRDFIKSAVAKGASIILYDGIMDTKNFEYLDSQINYKCYSSVKEEKSFKEENTGNTIYIAIDFLAYYIGILASYKYDYPSTKFATIGVTGTNGKTSITHWINQAYLLLGEKPAIIGTNGAGIYPNVTDYSMTTPDPITLQKLLSEFYQAKVDRLAMEVSSHSLQQGRVNGVSFKTAIFTNLTPDHLDYHKTMENYFIAKKSLFYWRDLQNAIVNLDDKYGNLLYKELKLSRKDINLLSYGIGNQDCDLSAFDIIMDFSGMRFKLNYRGQIQQFVVKLIGKFNIHNLLSVVAQLITDGYSLEQIANIAKELKPVRGRMDAIIIENLPLVVIDYAHTPDALYNTLITLREIPHIGKIYCVFGCGGDRDKSKRGLMGLVATENADYVVITTDNPRSEDPSSIIQDITSEIFNTSSNSKLENEYSLKIIEDRTLAIEHAIELAQVGDIVLVAGKGHETYQDIKGVKYDFSDFDVVFNKISNKVQPK